MARCNRRGFTLLELMLALGLSVLVMSIIVGLVGMYSSNFTTRGEDIRRVALARAILNMIADDLRSTVTKQEYDTKVLEQMLVGQGSSGGGAQSGGQSGGGQNGGQSGGGQFAGGQTGGNNGRGNNQNGNGNGGNPNVASGGGAGGGRAGGQNNNQNNNAQAGGATAGASQNQNNRGNANNAGSNGNNQRGNGQGQNGSNNQGNQNNRGSGGQMTGGTTGQSSGGSSGQSKQSGQSGDSTDQAATDDASTTSATQAVPLGIYGSATSLTIDVSRLPRVDEYNAQQNGMLNGTLNDLPGDIKSVSYEVQLPSTMGVTDTLSQVSTTQTNTTGVAGLVRRALDRAVMDNAEAMGQTTQLNRTGELVAPEVLALEFSYYDGTQWTTTWDSSTQGLPWLVDINLAMQSKSGEKNGAVPPGISLTTMPYADRVRYGIEVYNLMVTIPGAQLQSTSTSTDSSGAGADSGMSSVGL